MNCLPFLGHEKWEAFYACRLEGEARHRGQEGGDRALRARPRLRVGGEGAVGPARHRETMALRIPVVRKRGAAIHGRQAGQVHIRAEGRRRLGRGRRRHGQAGRHEGVRGHVPGAAQAGEPAGMRRPGPVQLLLRPRAPAEADAPGAAGRGGGDLLAHGQRVRPPPGRHVPARRAGRAHSRQDRAQDDAGDGGPLRHPPRDRLP